MFKNYFKIAWRNLWKNKIYTAINIIGLSVGMAACIVIMLFVFYERSFDKMHTKNLYRLNEVQKFEGMVAAQKVALSMFPMGPTLKNDFPEIKNYTRVNWHDNFQMTYQEKKIYFPEAFFVDSTFLQLFDFPLLKGNRQTALEKPHSVVLTRASAEKLFGQEDPMGRTVTHYGEDTLSFTVTGILENLPQNSQLQFDGLYSFNTVTKPIWMTYWNGNWLNTYFELAPGTDPKALEKKFPAYLKKYLAKDDHWKMYDLFLLPLADVHANSADIGLDYINYQKFDKTYTNLFFIIGLIVLVIACVNFMNLSTARSAERAREVGVRKSIGAQRIQLAMQFLGETVLLALIALLFSIVLLKLFLPSVNHLIRRELQLPVLTNPGLLLSIIAGTIVVGILSGLYPAAYLSSFSPVKVLKGTLQSGRDKGGLRNILVVGQFTCAVFLMIATIFVMRQLNYMQQRDPGFNRDQVVTLKLDRITTRKYDLLKESLLGSSLVSGVTAAQDQLGSHMDQSGMEFKGDGPLRQLTSTQLIVDPDYLSLYKIALVEGRNFSKEKSANGREFIVNESLARELLKDQKNPRLSSLIGKHFGFDSVGTIVGITKDFNFNSLQYKIETMYLYNQKEWGFSRVSVKVNAGKTKEAVSFIQATWSRIFPEQPLEYQFLDEHFAEVYRTDAQVSKVVSILAALAIIITCLGLFGLASYSAEKRTKEIGIRKVLGASVPNIVGILSTHFIKLVLIANLIAWPLAWLALNRWLQGYAYRIDISWWVFILAGLLALVIALGTVSILAIRAAVANPVKSLRSE